MWPFKKKVKKEVSEIEKYGIILPTHNEEDIKEQINSLKIRVYDKENQCAKEGKSWDECLKETYELRDKICELDMELRQVLSPGLIFGKKWNGQTVALDEFIDGVKNGKYRNGEGEGYYATEKAKSDINIYPNDILANRFRLDFDKVIWIQYQK